ncbi:GDP-mannose 4,6-dehydratase [Desulfogranum marinum]|uniref:GDP-mannose 4,6-dehydratase n=1 Tax=Desulfogranum marinum TaxID=453220 RepID=UPI0034DCE928
MTTVNKRVLVTGSCGFTGQYLVSELERKGWDVFGAGSSTHEGCANYRCIDLTSLNDVRSAVNELEPDIVVHLAAVAFVGHGNVDDFYHVNLLGTRNLLSALAESKKKPECVLLASSANVYGNTTDGMLSETMRPNPANDYAVSKLSMEFMARLWSEELPLVIVRPFNYTGVGQSESFLIPKIVSHFRNKSTEIELGNLDVSRDFSDVRSVVRIYRRLLEEQPIGETVNVCSGKLVSLKEIVTLAETITAHSMSVKVNPAFVRSNEVKTLCGDPSKLKRLIGDTEMFTLEETLRWMLFEDLP